MISLVALGLALARATPAQPPQSSSTALRLALKGNEYLSIQSRDKIVRIISDRSVNGLTPEIWHVVYFDPDTPFRCIEVKFAGGQEVEVFHPLHPFEFPGKASQVIDKDRLKVDSDQAIRIATGQPLLRSLGLRSTKLTLTPSDAGPVWKVQFWATKVGDPSREAEVGTVAVSAVDGAVLKSDLHPGRAR